MIPDLFRATVFHTPRNPFTCANALESFADGGLLVDDGRVLAAGSFDELRRLRSDAAVHDWRGSFVLPGFVDTHVHFPQLRIIGSMGRSLLDWLRERALPEEARMAAPEYARSVAVEFLRALASHGTTTALVFGAHFASAMDVFFEAAAASGLRIASGLVVSDRYLLPELHTTPDRAYRESAELIHRYHHRPGLIYAVTPRFALSASEPMLEVCRTLLREHQGVLFQTHLNENHDEIAEVARLFPWAQDYLDVYERYHLVTSHSVFAHNVHASDSELERLGLHRASVAHCPCSNASLQSGFFDLARHVAANVRVTLGTDVGAGTGFGMLKEGLQAYMLQRLNSRGCELTASHLLYMATRAGAEALGLGNETGDFSPGRSADFVRVQPPEGSVLESVARHADSAQSVLAGIFTLAGAESIRATYSRGRSIPQ